MKALVRNFWMLIPWFLLLLFLGLYQSGRLAEYGQSPVEHLTPDTAAQAAEQVLMERVADGDRPWYLGQVHRSVEGALETQQPASLSMHEMLRANIEADELDASAPDRVRVRLARNEGLGIHQVSALPPGVVQRVAEVLRRDGKVVRIPQAFELNVRDAFLCVVLVGMAACVGLGVAYSRGRALAWEVWACLGSVLSLSLLGLCTQAAATGLWLPSNFRGNLPVFVGGIVAGCLLQVLLSRWPGRLGVMVQVGYPLLGLSIMIIALLYWFSPGVGVDDAAINIPFFGLTFQPLEVLKFTTVMGVAQLLGHALEPQVQSAPQGESSSWKGLLARADPWAAWIGAASGGVILLVVGAVLGDMGLVAIVALAGALVYFVRQGSQTIRMLIKTATISVVLLLLSVGLLFLPLLPRLASALPERVGNRIFMWDQAFENLRPGLGQGAHAAWAFASGGWDGRNLATTRITDVEAGTTDLVLAWFAEINGLPWVLLLFALYSILVWTAFRIALNLPGRAGTRYALLAIPSVICAQVVVNVACAIGCAPMTGVVLPWLSRGRSSWGVFSFFIAFLVCRALWNAPERGAAAVRFARDGTHRAAALTMAVLLALPLGAGWKCWILMVRDGTENASKPLITLSEESVSEVSVQMNPRLERIIDGIRAPEVQDRELQTVAKGSEGERHYPFGESLVPVLGVSRGEVSPLHGTVERWVARNKGFPSRIAGCLLLAPEHHRAWQRMIFSRDRCEASVEVITYPDLRQVVPLLRAPPGEVLAFVTARNKAVLPVVLTLDAGLQRDLYTELNRLREELGLPALALVVDIAATGERLVEVSVPSIDPTALSVKAYGLESRVSWGRLRNFARHPLPPGSTFKAVTAAIALELGYGEDTRFTCDGPTTGDPDDPTRRRCPTRIHGNLDLREAQVQSCNSYFYQLANAIHRDEYLGQLFRLPVYRPPAILKFPEAGFGQDSLEVTADQLNHFFVAIANKGEVSVCLDDQGPLKDRPCRTLQFVGERAALHEWDILKDAVRRGTGKKALVDGVTVAGKTGTAQQGSIIGDVFTSEEGFVAGDRNHGWFSAILDFGRGSPLVLTLLAPRAMERGTAHDQTAGDVVAPLVPAIVKVLQENGYPKP